MAAEYLAVPEILARNPGILFLASMLSKNAVKIKIALHLLRMHGAMYDGELVSGPFFLVGKPGAGW